MGFDCDDDVQPAFNIERIQVLRPQDVSSETSVAQSAWPPPLELMKEYGDAVKQNRSIHKSVPKVTFAAETRMDKERK